MQRNWLRFLMALFPAVSYGQEDTTARKLDEVVVTALRAPAKELNTPYSLGTVSRKQLDDLGFRTTPEALMAVNGVFVQKTNHGGGSAFLRGLTGNQTLLLVDGIRLNNSTFRYGPNQYLNTIDAFTIRSIEVVKGTGAVQYGSDAMGGVIQVLTGEPLFSSGKPAWHGKVSGRYMTGGMEKTSRGEISYGTKKMALLVGGTYRHFGDIRGGDTTGLQTPSGYKELAFDAKMKFAIGNNAQLILANNFLQQKQVPVYHKVMLENFAVNEFEPQQRMLNYAKLDIQGRSAILKQLAVTASWQQTIEGRNSRKNGSGVLRREKDEVNTVGFTADVFSALSGIWTANSGIELYHDRVGSRREDINQASGTGTNLRGLYPDNSKYGNYSLYSLHHLAINKWMLDAGLRFNTFSIRIADSALGNVKITPAAFVYNAALMYCLSLQQSIYTSFSSGFRAPNTDDMGTLGIVDFRYEVPASNLSPEKSQHIELGYKFKNEKLSASFAAWYMHLENLITRVKEEGRFISGYPVYRKENTEAAQLKGLEGSVSWSIGKRLCLDAAANYTYGKNNTKNEPLRRVPPLNGRVMGRYQGEKIFVAAEWMFASKQDRLAQGDRDDNRIPKGGTPGWSVLNFYTGYRFTHFTCNAGLQNLLNEDYRKHGSGINGVGRSVWINLGWLF